MSAAEGHTVLVAEDDPTAAELLCRVVRSHGDSPRLARTVDEALRAIAEETFCYCIVDQQLPASAEDPTPMLGGGERIMAAIRKKDGRLNATKCHVTPILVVTGYSAHEDFVSKMYEQGCDAFVSKPLAQKLEILLDRIRAVTARAGRAEHAACEGLAAGAGPWVAPEPRETNGAGRLGKRAIGARTAAPVGTVRLAIDGKTGNGRTSVEVNGTEAPVRDAELAVLLKLVVVRERSADAWSTREALGLVGNRYTTSRLRASLAPALPEGFEMIEGDRRGLFRLNPAVVVERVAWEVLREHPEGRVRKVVERRKG